MRYGRRSRTGLGRCSRTRLGGCSRTSRGSCRRTLCGRRRRRGTRLFGSGRCDGRFGRRMGCGSVIGRRRLFGDGRLRRGRRSRRSGTLRGGRDRLERRDRFGRSGCGGRFFGGRRLSANRRLRLFGGRGRSRGGFCCGLRSGGGSRLQQNAADEIRNVFRNDAELILRLENAAKAFVKERDELFGRKPNLFRKFKNPNFSRSQIQPFKFAGAIFRAGRRLRGACDKPYSSVRRRRRYLASIARFSRHYA